MKNLLSIGLCICLCFFGSMSLGQGGVNWNKIDISKLSPEDKHLLSEMYDMSLEQLDSLKATGHVPTEFEKLLNSMIAVASKKAMTYRQVPNIISLITAEEIRKMGARDLVDVLRLIPGFHLVLDRSGKVSIGIRGNVASEGKVLLLIDGQMMNEIYGGNIALGNRYPVDLIEKIEIIRGPGSAIYGGFAAYGVINIITKKQNGISLGGIGAQWRDSETISRENYFGSLGLKWNNGRLDFAYYGGRGQRSEQEQFGQLGSNLGIGNVVSLARQSSINPQFYNVHLQLGNFHVRNITDLYEVQDVSVINQAGIRPIKQQLRSSNLELKYDLSLFKKRLTITPKVQLIAQMPSILAQGDTSEIPLSNQFSVRALANTTLNWDISHRINLTLGAETWVDATDVETNNDIINISDSLAVYNAAFFGQLVILTDFANITAGLRYDNYLLPNLFAGANFQSSYEAFAPRIAFTRRFGEDRSWHIKLLASGAFRAPTIGNVVQAFDGTYELSADSSALSQLGTEIEPEQSLVLEAEIGHQINQDMMITANFFRIHTQSPIIYHFFQDEQIAQVFGEDRGLFVYQNFPSSGTYGLELGYNFKRKWGHFHVNYAYYAIGDHSVPAPYAVSSFALNPTNRDILNGQQSLAFPKHQLNLNLGLNLSRNLSLNLTGSYLSERYGFEWVQDGASTYRGQLQLFPEQYLLNTFVNYDNFIFRGLNIGFGVHDILDQRTPFIQPYFGLNPALPGSSREFIFKASFDLHFYKRKSQQRKLKQEREAPIYYDRKG